MLKRQTGFTLIELIVVIVILGILAATALPKFMGIQSSARISILSGARGAVASASSMAAAVQQAQNLTSNVGVTMDGISVTMVGGYPTANAAGIVAVAGLSTDYTATAGGAGLNTAVGIQVNAAPNPATCAFSYTSASVVGGAVLAPAITAPVTTGC